MIFQEKYFSCYALLTNQISFPDCLYVLRYWLIYVLQLFVNPSCNVINFEINLILLTKSFFDLTKNSRQKFKYFENEKSFEGEIKRVFFIIFKGISVAKNILGLESARLKEYIIRYFALSHLFLHGHIEQFVLQTHFTLFRLP